MAQRRFPATARSSTDRRHWQCLAGTLLPLLLTTGAAAQLRTQEGALSAIRESDIRADLFTLAGDSMRGREAGTLDELKASAWIAERARAAGLEPAGDFGTFFQWWDMRRVRQSSTSTVLLDGQPLELWRDVALSGLADRELSAPIVWVSSTDSTVLAQFDLRGKVAAIPMSPPSNQLARSVSLSSRRYATAVINNTGRILRAHGSVAVLLVADSLADSAFESVAANARRGRFLVDNGQEARPPSASVPVLWVRQALAGRVRAAQKLDVRLLTESFVYPSVNVVARVTGTDSSLRHEHVLFSAHQDHDGVRAPVDGDSIYNGADDNASVAVAVLAIGRAFAQQPGRRSALFVWHGAEERGLLGSRYHAEHPVVPRQNIAAVLNADMIGRNHPDSAALLGAVPPHRSSTDLVNLALDANAQVTRFAIDSTWDRPDHPEGWYFRSDHLPYARLNIPAVYFSSLLHTDYHTPRDEPERMDTAKLTRMARWMYATGWRVAQADQRPRLDPGFKLERDD
jgi:hypothetical protein